MCVVGGKAAPGYEMAKRIIKLISAVGATINADPDVGDLLKLVFVPDYNVSLAEVIIPGAPLLPDQALHAGGHAQLALLLLFAHAPGSKPWSARTGASGMVTLKL